MRKCVWSVGLLVILLCLASPLMAGTSVITVKAAVANLRSGPGTGYVVVGKAAAGTRMTVLQNRNGWYQVQYGKGTAWVAGWLVNQVNGGNKVTASSSGNGRQNVVVQASVVNLRSGPGTGYAVVGKANSGTQLVVIQAKSDWYQVQYGKGTAWVAGWLVKKSGQGASSNGNTTGQPAQQPPTSSPVSGSGFVAGSTVNLRSGPGTNYEMLDQLSYGTPLVLLNKADNWYQVRLPGGKTGWLIATLVQMGAHGAIVPAGDVSRGEVDRQEGQAAVPEDVDRQVGGSAEVELAQVEYAVSESLEKVTLHLSGKTTKFNVFRLGNPDRLVVDIPGARPGNGLTEVNSGGELVSRIRTGYFSKEPDQVRVVLDLHKDVWWESRVDEQTGSIQLLLRPATSSRNDTRKLIVLDAGHGGNDPGAIGPNGTREKNINLDIVLRLAEILRRQGVEVLLTRSDDTYVDLYERTALANRAGAALFVSVHCNANQNPAYSGTSTYFVRTSVEENRQLQQQSAQLARILQQELVNQLGRKDIGVLQANFAVLRTSTMPAALVEVAFLSNPEEEILLGDGSFRQKAAQAIASGLLSYLQQKMAVN